MNNLATQILLSSRDEKEALFKAKALGTKSDDGVNAVYTFVDSSTLYFDQMFGKVMLKNVCKGSNNYV